MINSTKKIYFLKSLVRISYRFFLSIYIILFSKKSCCTFPSVFYGGARSGDVGGPLVKIQRLTKFFPQRIYNFNTVYLLSNAPYLSDAALISLQSRRIPIILNQNGIYYPAWFPDGWRQYNRQLSLAYHKADYVFWQSSFCQRSANLFLGDRTGPGEILYNAVDLNVFRPSLHTSRKSLVFLITGKFNSHLYYRIESTIAGLVFARQAGLNATLLVSGYLEDLSLFQELLSKYNAHNFVSYTGPYTQANAPEIYQSADVYVMTKYLDPCPNSVIEALACGLPVLYSATGGVPELVGPKAGIGLALPEDWNHVHVPTPHDICSGMLTIAEMRSTFSSEARLRAEKVFDLKNWYTRHETIFNSYLSS